MKNAAKNRIGQKTTGQKTTGQKTTGRKATSLNPKLDKRLAAYVAAGTAAGVGFLALAPSADARIIYTPANVQIHDGSFAFHLTPNGPDDVGFRQQCARGFCELSAYAEAGNAIQAIFIWQLSLCLSP